MSVAGTRIAVAHPATARPFRAGFVLLACLCGPAALAGTDAAPNADVVCRIIDSSALSRNLPTGFLTRLIWRESNFRIDAASPVGARGIAQFMPATAAERGLSNPDDPEAAIPKAAELLADLKQRFGNLGLAAAAYNAGPTRVAAWLAGASDLPSETRDYVLGVTQHAVEDWRGVSGMKLTEGAVFPDSCVHYVASVRRAGPPIATVAFLAGWDGRLSAGFSKGTAMWNGFVSALNALLASAPVDKLAGEWITWTLVLAAVVFFAMACFLFAYVRRPIRSIREEIRRNHLHLEAILRGGDPAPSMLAAVASPLRVERGERPIDRPELPAGPQLGLFDRKDHDRPSNSLAAWAQGESAHSSPSLLPAPKAEALSEDAKAAPDSGPQEKAIGSLGEFVPVADAAFRAAPPLAKGARRRKRRVAVVGVGAAVALAGGAIAVFAAPGGLSFDVIKTPLDAITHSSERDEQRAAIRDLGAALAQANARLDRMDRDYAARLDKLGERGEQGSSSGLADIAARLDKLEQRAAQPAAPAAGIADLEARLDRLEKKPAPPPQPGAQMADVIARLDKLEKNAALATAPAAKTATGALTDQAGNRAVAPSPVPQQSPTLLRDYSLGDVRNGIAMVRSRYGLQPVGPGAELPGAGRVLRIERRNGAWLVVTSLGVIAPGPAPR